MVCLGPCETDGYVVLGIQFSRSEHSPAYSKVLGVLLRVLLFSTSTILLRYSGHGMTLEVPSIEKCCFDWSVWVRWQGLGDVGVNFHMPL